MLNAMLLLQFTIAVGPLEASAFGLSAASPWSCRPFLGLPCVTGDRSSSLQDRVPFPTALFFFLCGALFLQLLCSIYFSCQHTSVSWRSVSFFLFSKLLFSRYLNPRSPRACVLLLVSTLTFSFLLSSVVCF